MRVQRGLIIRLYPNHYQKLIIKQAINNVQKLISYYKTNHNYKNKVEFENDVRKHLLDITDEYNYSKLNLYINNYYYHDKHNTSNASKKENQILYIPNTYNSIYFKNNMVNINILGEIKCKLTKDINNKVILCSYLKINSLEQYTLSINYIDYTSDLPKQSNKVGIDIGIRKLITTNHNEVFTPNNNLKKIELNINKYQRKLNRTSKTYENGEIKHSNNYYNIKKQINKLYIHRKNIINDFIQKTTTYLVKKYDVIIMEDLDIKRLINHQEIKSIRNSIYTYCFGKIKKCLQYKTKYYNKKLIIISKYYPSSKICSYCGRMHDPQREELFVCPFCHNTIDRDLNAAINIYNYDNNRW